MAYYFGIPSGILAIEYALEISGRTQRLKETLLGLLITVHRWIIYGSVPFWLLLLIHTGSEIMINYQLILFPFPCNCFIMSGNYILVGYSVPGSTFWVDQ